MNNQPIKKLLGQLKDYVFQKEYSVIDGQGLSKVFTIIVDLNKRLSIIEKISLKDNSIMNKDNLKEYSKLEWFSKDGTKYTLTVKTQDGLKPSIEDQRVIDNFVGSAIQNQIKGE